MKQNRMMLIVGLCMLVAVTIYANHLLNAPKKEETPPEPTTLYQPLETAAFEHNNANGIVFDDTGTPVGAGLSSDPAIPSGDSFAAFRSDRDSVREKEIAYLDSMIAETTTDDETRKEANQQKLDLIGQMEKEVTIEGLLKAKGFGDVAVTVHKGSVNVVVAEATLDQTQVAQILDIAQRESGEPAENIKVVPKNG